MNELMTPATPGLLNNVYILYAYAAPIYEQFSLT